MTVEIKLSFEVDDTEAAMEIGSLVYADDIHARLEGAAAMIEDAVINAGFNVEYMGADVDVDNTDW